MHTTAIDPPSVRRDSAACAAPMMPSAPISSARASGDARDGAQNNATAPDADTKRMEDDGHCDDASDDIMEASDRDGVDENAIRRDITECDTDDK